MKKIFILDKGWKFRKEADISKLDLNDYFNMFASDSKTGMSSDARGCSFYDGDWDEVDLPDDWNTREKCSQDYEDTSQGHKPLGPAWYRKNFTMKSRAEGKRIFLKFDAIAGKSDIWLNAVKIAHSESGYTPLYVEVTDFIKIDRQNCLSIRCDNTVKEGWWYEGGGIYGSVHLIEADEAFLTEYGTFVHSEREHDDIWRVYVDIEAELANDQYSLHIISQKLGIEKNIAAERKNSLEVIVKVPKLWSVKEPELYEFEIKLFRGAELIDSKTVYHGFRTIEFDSERGFFLNGEALKLKGVCLHHDFSGVGVAIPREIQRFRISKLKEMGCNAIRTSHNPQLEGFYEVCDELGMLVMDEARHFSSTIECLGQLRTLVCRDRNHASVIMWSIFNEEPLQCTPVGRKMARTMKNLIYTLDGTRPVTGGMNGPMEIEGVVKEVDIVGFNYGQYEYDEFHKIYPHIPIIGSETASYLTTRDTVVNDKPYLSSFGNTLYENLYKWSANIGDTWRYIDKREFVAGGFDWTGFDYRGECGEFPEAVCNFGAMDLCGFPKGAYYWHKVLWDDSLQIYLSPYWDYQCGEQVQIACYSNCDEIEVYLNNVRIYAGFHDKYEMSIIRTCFEPGELRAVGYSKKKPVAECVLNSPSGDKKLVLQPVRNVMTNRHDDWNIVNIFLKDENDNIVHPASDEVFLEIKGGKIIGVGNGDVCRCEEERRNSVRLFHGCAQVIVCAEKNMEIIARCGAIENRCCIQVNEYDNDIYILNENVKSEIATWRQSDVQEHYIEKQFIADLMFAWIPTTVGYGKNLLYSGKKGYSEICGQIAITPNMKSRKFAIIMERIQGTADIYLNHDFIESFTDGENICIPIDMCKYNDSVVLSVVFKLDGGECGIVGNVYVSEMFSE